MMCLEITITNANISWVDNFINRTSKWQVHLFHNILQESTIRTYI